MNKQGQTMALTIISSIFVFIIGMLILNFLMPSVDDARIALNCSDASSISDGQKITCLAIDGLIPYWIILVFSIVIGAITSRMFM